MVLHFFNNHGLQSFEVVPLMPNSIQRIMNQLVAVVETKYSWHDLL
jgi:hypothetical protein